MTADNLPKGKVPMLERWGYMFIQQSYRNDGVAFLCALVGNKNQGAYIKCVQSNNSSDKQTTSISK